MNTNDKNNNSDHANNNDNNIITGNLRIHINTTNHMFLCFSLGGVPVNSYCVELHRKRNIDIARGSGGLTLSQAKGEDTLG